MNGILCINKPPEYTSFDVVARIRGMSKTKRVGHSGTLDPMATGVLPIFLGVATKSVGLLPNENKKYLADFCLGVITDTLDKSGKILSKTQSNVRATDILELLTEFKGEISQIPPMYSAVKVNGQRLYDIARQGKEVQRKSRKITVYSLELIDFDEASQRGSLSVCCSKGTYVRSIISDIGDRLGVGGIMTGLVRTEASGFTLDDCISLDEAQEFVELGCFEKRLLSVDKLFLNFPVIHLNKVQSVKFRNGLQLDLNRLNYKDMMGFHRVYDSNENFLALASLDKLKMSLKIEKTFFI